MFRVWYKKIRGVSCGFHLTPQISGASCREHQNVSEDEDWSCILDFFSKGCIIFTWMPAWEFQAICWKVGDSNAICVLKAISRSLHYHLGRIPVKKKAFLCADFCCHGHPKWIYGRWLSLCQKNKIHRIHAWHIYLHLQYILIQM